MKILYEGWLSKASRSRTTLIKALVGVSWEKRWCRLEAGSHGTAVLKYFRSPEHTTELGTVLVVEESIIESDSSAFSIHIIAPVGTIDSNRSQSEILRLKSDNAVEHLAWTLALNKVSQHVESANRSDSTSAITSSSKNDDGVRKESKAATISGPAVEKRPSIQPGLWRFLPWRSRRGSVTETEDLSVDYSLSTWCTREFVELMLEGYIDNQTFQNMFPPKSGICTLIESLQLVLDALLADTADLPDDLGETSPSVGQAHDNDDVSSASLRLCTAIENCLDLAARLNQGIEAAELDTKHELLGMCVSSVSRQLLALSPGEVALLPAGWTVDTGGGDTGKSGSQHIILLAVVQSIRLPNYFDVGVINTDRDGCQYHPKRFCSSVSPGKIDAASALPVKVMREKLLNGAFWAILWRSLIYGAFSKSSSVCLTRNYVQSENVGAEHSNQMPPGTGEARNKGKSNRDEAIVYEILIPYLANQTAGQLAAKAEERQLHYTRGAAYRRIASDLYNSGS